MKSAVVDQFRTRKLELLKNPNRILFRDGRTREAKRDQAQVRLLIAMATDEELAEMAKIEGELIPSLVNKSLEEWKQLRDRYRASVESWRKYLAPKTKRRGGDER